MGFAFGFAFGRYWLGWFTLLNYLFFFFCLIYLFRFISLGTRRIEAEGQVNFQLVTSSIVSKAPRPKIYI